MNKEVPFLYKYLINWMKNSKMEVPISNDKKM